MTNQNFFKERADDFDPSHISDEDEKSNKGEQQCIVRSEEYFVIHYPDCEKNNDGKYIPGKDP